MLTSSSRLLSIPVVLGLSLGAGACKEEVTTPKLFEEAGVWSVVKYDLEGSGETRDIDNMNRRDAFMIAFDDVEGVVTTASCVDDDNPEATPANSGCRLSASTTRWSCSCYGYDFVREEMLWREFNAGDVPPEVSLEGMDEPPASDETGTGGGGAGPEGDTSVFVAEVPDINSTYNFRPLPEGIFGSNGMTSRYILEARAGSLIDQVFEDPDGRPTCDPCI